MENEQKLPMPIDADTDVNAVMQAVHTAKRKALQARDKLTQPEVGVAMKRWDLLRAAMLADLTDAERAQQGLDYLCQSVQDSLAAGDVEDTIFALVRVWRKAWALQPHLGPIRPPAPKPVSMPEPAPPPPGAVLIPTGAVPIPGAGKP